MFKKYGDPEPIKSFYDDNLELQTCDECGKPLTIVALDNDNNEILCKCSINKDAREKEQNEL
jgi:ssDNA-binding Zn-finger/Zn-ribbon topoisomerase 1